MQLPEFLLQVIGGQAHADVELGGQRIDARRHIPATTFELLAHDLVEVGDVKAKRDERERGDEAGAEQDFAHPGLHSARSPYSVCRAASAASAAVSVRSTRGPSRTDS